MATEMIFDGDGFLTVVDGMVACGMDHDALFQDETQAQRLATDIFGNQFSACLDVTFKEHADEHFKTYSDLTAAQGRILIRPGDRENNKAFVQWTRDELRLDRDPALTPFPVAEVVGKRGLEGTNWTAACVSSCYASCAVAPPPA